MISAATIGAIVAVETIVLWGPIIALVTAITVAVITSKSQVRAAEKTAQSAESSILLTGYNQLVASLQQQVSEVQKDYDDLRERAIRAETAAEAAQAATVDCERHRHTDRADHARAIQDMNDKHDRQMALMHAELAAMKETIKENNQ